jgi:ribose/xylose/arabinose/galactoside ABC-type transport system permease subunit
MSKKRFAIKKVPVSVVAVVVGVVVSVVPPGVVGGFVGGIVGGSVEAAGRASKIIASYARNVIARGLTLSLQKF